VQKEHLACKNLPLIPELSLLEQVEEENHEGLVDLGSPGKPVDFSLKGRCCLYAVSSTLFSQ